MRKFLFLLLLFVPVCVKAQGTQVVTLATDPPTCSVGMTYYNSTTNTLKSCGPANTWSTAGGAPTPGVFNSNFDPPLFQNYTLTTTGAQTGINLTANPIDTHTISWRLSGSLATNITDAIAYSNGDLHTANASWVYQTGTFNVNSNAAFGSSATSLAYRSDGANTASEFAQETVVETVVSATQNHGPCVRVQTGAFSGYCLQLATNTFIVGIWNAGAFTPLGTFASSAPVTGDVVKITAVGSTISGYKNGILIGSVTDATFSTGETGAYSAASANSNGFSNFQSGQIPSCTIALDGSPDGVTWNAGSVIPAQNCGTVPNGSFQAVVPNAGPGSTGTSFVRVNVTALSSPLTLTVIYSGRLAPAGPNTSTAPVTNAQYIQAGQAIWTQVTTQGLGTVTVNTQVQILQANGSYNTGSQSVSCLTAAGGVGFAFVAPVSGWLTSVITDIGTTGFPQGSFYINDYIIPSIPSGGTTTTCTNAFNFSQALAMLTSGVVGSSYPVSFVGTSYIPSSPWSIPGFTTTLVPTTPGAGAEISFTFSTVARTCVQAISAQLVTSSSAANRVPAFVLTVGGAPIVYSGSTAQTASLTQIYSLSPGASAETVTGGSTVYHIVPFNNGQMICANANQAVTFTTLTNQIQAGDQWTPKGIVVQMQQDNN